jgi:hypothetical protein
MPGGLWDSSLTRVRPFFEALITRDHGASWLGPLLKATPRGRSVFGDVLAAPGTLPPTLTAPRPKTGVRQCFEFRVAPPRGLLVWFVANPDELVWPKGQTYSEEATRKRESLVLDKPAGTRAEVQAEAMGLAETRPTTAHEWWRFEGTSMIDCMLMTERLVLTVEGKRRESTSAATDWYPKRSQLVRNLEAAKQLAAGRAWGSLLMSETPIAAGSDAGLDAVMDDSAPHLTPAERRELHAHCLGNVTWQAACVAVGIEFAALPPTRAPARPRL